MIPPHRFHTDFKGRTCGYDVIYEQASIHRALTIIYQRLIHKPFNRFVHRTLCAGPLFKVPLISSWWKDQLYLVRARDMRGQKPSNVDFAVQTSPKTGRAWHDRIELFKHHQTIGFFGPYSQNATEGSDITLYLGIDDLTPDRTGIPEEGRYGRAVGGDVVDPVDFGTPGTRTVQFLQLVKAGNTQSKTGAIVTGVINCVGRFGKAHFASCHRFSLGVTPATYAVKAMGNSGIAGHIPTKTILSVLD